MSKITLPRKILLNGFQKISTKRWRCLICKRLITQKLKLSTVVLQHLKTFHVQLFYLMQILQSKKKSPIKMKKTPQQVVKNFGRIDRQIVRMIAERVQNFGIVEMEEFKELVYLLNPSYEIPDRKLLETNLLPQMYDDLQQMVKRSLATATSISLTINRFELMDSEQYVSVSAHFVDSDWSRKSYFLEAFQIPEDCQSTSLADELRRVVTTWGISEKVCSAITPKNTTLMVAVDKLQWLHVPCFIQTMDLIIKEGLIPLSSGIRNSVKHSIQMLREAKSNKKLQAQVDELQLLNRTWKIDKYSRWIQIHEKFNEMLEISKAMNTAMNQSGNDDTTVDSAQHIIISQSAEISILNFTLEVLSTFFAIEVEISESEVLLASKVIFYLRAIGQQLAVMQVSPNLPKGISVMVRTLSEQVVKHFNDAEMNLIYSQCSFLDPRFKKESFSRDNAYQKAQHIIISQAAQVPMPATPKKNQPSESSSLIWEDFDDELLEKYGQTEEKPTEMAELDRYLTETHADRRSDPFYWWKIREKVYPRLSKIAKKRLGIVVTSVPNSTIFGKDNTPVPGKRYMSGEDINRMLFLQANA